MYIEVEKLEYIKFITEYMKTYKIQCETIHNDKNDTIKTNVLVNGEIIAYREKDKENGIFRNYVKEKDL